MPKVQSVDFQTAHNRKGKLLNKNACFRLLYGWMIVTGLGVAIGCASTPANEDNSAGGNAGGDSSEGGSAGNASGGNASGGNASGGVSGGKGGSSLGGKGGSAGSSGGAAGGAGGVSAGGSGGSGGSSAGGGAGGEMAPGNVLFSENFESGTVGMQPAGWDNFVGWVKNAKNPQDNVFAIVADARKHGGAKSIHFKGGQQPAMITKPLPNGTNKVYVRAFVYLSQQLGAITDTAANHETLLGLRATSGNASDEVRFGEIKGAIGTNEVPSDNISPKQDKWHKANGPSIAANTWTCVEVGFLGDKANHELQAWFDDKPVHAVTSPDQWNNGALKANWLDGKFKEVMLGWHSFSSRTVEVWMDDVVVATSRVGCN